MSRRNKPSKQTKPAQAPRGPLAQIADHLPGNAPIAERVKRVVTHHASFEGPIPHPEIFRQYGEVIPDAPERILKVFEEDSKHAREIQMAALNAQKSDNQRVHWMAWSLIAGGFSLSGFFAWIDKDILAGAILTTTLAGTITGFLQNRKDNNQT